MSDSLPVLALTIGDPAGVGPELALRAACAHSVRGVCRLVLVGDACSLEAAREAARFTGAIRVMREDGLKEALAQAAGDAVELLDTGTLKQAVPWGVPSIEGGRASYAAIMAAIRLARAGVVAGVVTGPISKTSLKLAGVNFIGHTEIFGSETETSSYAMMMYSDRLAVGLVTCHEPLSAVPGLLRRERIVEVGSLLARSVERIRGERPRMAVLGLNPHAGEDGLMGREELEIVAPAVKGLRAMGIDATGPLPPDTAFTRRALAEYDAHLCMYHDQGLIPFKMISFEDGVNVTMGLPFPRTSVDHGTAFDIAGQGVAEMGSLLAAVELAARLV